MVENTLKKESISELITRVVEFGKKHEDYEQWIIMIRDNKFEAVFFPKQKNGI